MSRVLNVAIVILAGTMSLGSFGQTPQAPAENTTVPQSARRNSVASVLDRMTRRLNLSGEQREQITPVLQDEQQQARAIRQDTSLTPEQRRGKLWQLRDSTRAQVESLLTPEQVARMARPRGRPGMGGQAMARMARRLNLTDDQKAKIKPLLSSQHEQVKAVRSDKSLTTTQKQDRIGEIRKSTHQQVVALLTPEQQERLKEMRGNRHRGGEAIQAPTAQPEP